MNQPAKNWLTRAVEECIRQRVNFTTLAMSAKADVSRTLVDAYEQRLSPARTARRVRRAIIRMEEV